MKTYKITVNGVAYDVTVEEVGSSASTVPTPISAPVPATVAAPKPAAKAQASGSPVKAPMPGTITDVKVKVGDTVKKNQAVCVLEAMKMKNEIVTSFEGTVTGINVAVGASVNAGDVLITVG